MLLWFLLLALLASGLCKEDYHLTPLRCPKSWEVFLRQLQDIELLLSQGQAPRARLLLSAALEDVLGPGVGSASQVRSALEDCAVGLGAALRLGAMSHFGDPAVPDASSEVQVAALEVALRLQHLAAGWLIYAYNGPAEHQDSFIDESLWPIHSNTFGDEHRSVAALLKSLKASTPSQTAADARQKARCLAVFCSSSEMLKVKGIYKS